VKIEFKPLSASLIPACRAFNERLRRHRNAPFFLPEDAPAEREPRPNGIERTHYIGVDETGEARGGVLVMEQRGWFRQETIRLVNVQSPLSEGVADRTYSGVGLRLLQFIESRSPYVYAVGMGNDRNPFARLLRAAGWRLTPVPFQFSVIRASGFLREVAPERGGSVRWLGRLAASSGVGGAAVALWRLAHRRWRLGGYALDPVRSWPDELDAVWERCRARISLSVLRDAQTVSDLHPQPGGRLKAFLLRRRGEIVGWSANVVTRMRSDANFGNLTVGTILDLLASPEHLGALISLTHTALCELGADLIITNQAHEDWRRALRRFGFLGGPTNYLLALSRPLALGLQQGSQALGRVYVSRADGDGRIHL
jgi:hypothetical protein